MPEAIMVVAFCAFVAFLVWVLFGRGYSSWRLLANFQAIEKFQQHQLNLNTAQEKRIALLEQRVRDKQDG